MNNVPLKGQVTHDDGWICLWCNAMICVNCYSGHGPQKHTEKVSADKGKHPNKKKKK